MSAAPRHPAGPASAKPRPRLAHPEPPSPQQGNWGPLSACSPGNLLLDAGIRHLERLRDKTSPAAQSAAAASASRPCALSNPGERAWPNQEPCRPPGYRNSNVCSHKNRGHGSCAAKLPPVHRPPNRPPPLGNDGAWSEGALGAWPGLRPESLFFGQLMETDPVRARAGQADVRRVPSMCRGWSASTTWSSKPAPHRELKTECAAGANDTTRGRSRPNRSITIRRRFSASTT